MRRFHLVTICLVAACASFADTNELERLRAEFVAARRAYMDARKAAGLTNAAPPRVRSTATTFTKAQSTFFRNRRICVSRDTSTIPGSVITTWYRNGKPDTLAPAVVTNILHNISGSVQDNPLQALVERWRERATSAEARAERLDRLREWLVEQRDKAPLQTMKAIYQAIIDRIDERLEGME